MNKKKLLTKEELVKISNNFYFNNCLDKSAISDWTKFVCEAITTGVSQFDIDQFDLSDEEFEKKYKKS